MINNLQKDLLTIEVLRLSDLESIKSNIIKAVKTELNKIENKSGSVTHSRDYLTCADVKELNGLLATLEKDLADIKNRYEEASAARTALIKAQHEAKTQEG